MIWRNWDKVQKKNYGLHVPTEEAMQKLTRYERWRVLFWGHLNDWVEARWLAANGWQEIGEGLWRLPDWHPKRHNRGKRDRREDKRGFADSMVYDQNHASNSQRHYIWAVQTRTTLLQKYPSFPTYHRHKRRINVLMTISTGMFILGCWYWSPILFLLAAALGVCQTLYVSRVVRSGLELEYAEERLGRAHGEQGLDQIGR